MQLTLPVPARALEGLPASLSGSFNIASGLLDVNASTSLFMISGQLNVINSSLLDLFALTGGSTAGPGPIVSPIGPGDFPIWNISLSGSYETI